MTASDVLVRMTDRISNLQGDIGALNTALKDQAEQAKRFPDLTKQIAETEARLAKVTADLATAQQALDQAQRAREKLVKQLTG